MQGAKTKQNKKKGNVFRNAHSDRYYLISTCWRTWRKSKLFFFLIIGLNGIGCGGYVRMCTLKATEGLGQLKGKYHRLRHNKWVINKLAADLQKRAQPSVPSLCLWNNTTPRAEKCYGPSLHSMFPSRTSFSINKSHLRMFLLKVKYSECTCCRADPKSDSLNGNIPFVLLPLWQEVLLTFSHTWKHFMSSSLLGGRSYYLKKEREDRLPEHCSSVHRNSLESLTMSSCFYLKYPLRTAGTAHSCLCLHGICIKKKKHKKQETSD